MKSEKKVQFKELLPAAALLAAIGFLLFVYAPIELLMANGYEFCYTVYDIFKYMLPVFLGFILLGFVVCFTVYRISKKAYGVLLALLLAGLLILYVQGTFFASNLPALDGRKIIWSDFSYQRWISLGILIISLGIAFLLWKKGLIGKISNIIGFGLLGMLVITSLMLIIQTGSYDPVSPVVHTAIGEMDLSDDENFIVFLVDAVDEEAFEYLLDAHPEYKDEFEDFTSFSNVTSGYPYTSRSIPFMLSGQWFENEQEFGDYFNSIVHSSPLFKALQKENYRMGFYDPEFFYVSDLPDVFENVVTGFNLKYPDKFVRMQIKMAGYRYFPFDLKRFCYLTPEDIYIDTYVENTDFDAPKYSMDNDEFYADLKSRDVNVVSDKCFRYLYIRGAHEPFKYPSQSSAVEDNTYLSSVEYGMEIVGEYLNKLKEAGVYDNSVIIILADHGYVEDDVPFGRQNPFMLIKGRNEKHEFTVNDAPVSHEDLTEAYSRLLAGADSFSLFDYKEDDSRSRRFLFFEYMKEDKMTEYYQNGHADDESTMVASGREFNFAEN